MHLHHVLQTLHLFLVFSLIKLQAQQFTLLLQSMWGGGLQQDFRMTVNLPCHQKPGTNGWRSQPETGNKSSWKTHRSSMKFWTLIRRKSKQKPISSWDTHALLDSVDQIKTKHLHGSWSETHQYNPPNLIRGKNSYCILIVCITHRLHMALVYPLGAKGTKHVYFLRENVGRVGVLYRIWEKSMCKTCSCDISRRGATSKNFHTSNLINHLKTDLR